jgi:hypothetical protein
LALLLVAVGGSSAAGPELTLAWAQTAQGDAGGADQASAITVDQNGYVYVTGRSSGDGTDYDYLTVCYDPAFGDPLWTARYDGPVSGEDSATAIAVDNLGSVYVTGRSYGGEPELGGTHFDVATVKYDAATGAELGVERYDAGVGGEDLPNVMALDNAGNVFIGGTTFQSFEVDHDYLLLKYAVDGSGDWVRTYNGNATSYDEIRSLAISAAGDVAVTGLSWGGATADSGTDYDYATLSYSSAGDEKWIALYDGSGGEDRATDVVVDANGDVIVHGYSSDPSTGFDFATLKYQASDGQVLWTSRYNTSTANADFATQAVVDAAGDVYVTGFTGTAPGQDFATVKLSGENGDQLWAKLYNGPLRVQDQATSIIEDGAGGVWVGGFSIGLGTGADYALVNYSSEGDQQSVLRYNAGGNSDDRPSGVVLDTSGNLYLTGTSGTGFNADYLTVKYASNQPPVADAGGDQQVECAGPLTDVSLDGSLSYDPDGDVLSFEWFEAGSSIATEASPVVGLTLGLHELELVVTDSKGVAANDTVIIDVVDTTAPVIAPNPDLNLPNDPRFCSATLSPTPVQAYDACDDPVVVGARDDGAELDAPYYAGTTVITWTASDLSGNSATSTQRVVVKDMERPDITCTGDLSVPQDTAKGSVVNYDFPPFIAGAVATDNCPGIALNCIPASGSLFPVGRTTVTCTATDAAGNSSVCTFRITVVAPTSTPGAQVSGSGRVLVANRSVPFVIDASVRNGVPRGTLSFQLPGQPVVSTAITSITVQGNQARVFGDTLGRGRAREQFILTVEDVARPGTRRDTAGIELSSGLNIGKLLLISGDVQVKPLAVLTSRH